MPNWQFICLLSGYHSDDDFSLITDQQAKLHQFTSKQMEGPHIYHTLEKCQGLDDAGHRAILNSKGTNP